MKNETEVPSRKEIWKMFDQISGTYDFVNRVMTFGLDKSWRRRLCKYLPEKKNLVVLDCATGTGDQVVALMETNKNIASVIGIDLAEEMVAIGIEKLKKKTYAQKVELQVASALKIPYPENHFDCVTISFGIRNVTDVMAAFKEFMRVLKPGGRVLILEGTVPEGAILKNLQLFYLRNILPLIGGIISKQPQAYRYLNETIETFPRGERFCDYMRCAGFVDVKANPVWRGMTTVYQGDKDGPASN
ncbi:MAG: bifunctional demethylmenaquinone methyltransferase/2-methoxy-6-polyprenyl-1,4-benzoquinol methylase UbiE [Candidatus Melainabacteria bacterium]|nr:bifunctional demethylmenaquinone methyltransferase/2-methoxy-6-polyprenyl-1,4-benzoquinol methylase UbiE [Candidatus Melainabacteria bacterium]